MFQFNPYTKPVLIPTRAIAALCTESCFHIGRCLLTICLSLTFQDLVLPLPTHNSHMSTTILRIWRSPYSASSFSLSMSFRTCFLAPGFIQDIASIPIVRGVFSLFPSCQFDHSLTVHPARYLLLVPNSDRLCNAHWSPLVTADLPRRTHAPARRTIAVRYEPRTIAVRQVVTVDLVDDSFPFPSVQRSNLRLASCCRGRCCTLGRLFRVFLSEARSCHSTSTLRLSVSSTIQYPVDPCVHIRLTSNVTSAARRVPPGNNKHTLLLNHDLVNILLFRADTKEVILKS